jgi:hypothetical protein
MNAAGILIATAILALAPGCANKFYTAKLDSDLNVAKGGDGKRSQQIDGVIVYMPKRIMMIFEFTAFEDAAGNVIATADGQGARRCLKQQHVEFKTQPDYSQPYALRNVPSQFASGSLEVHLTDGMITSVNSSSDPQLDETITALANAAEKAAGIAMKGAALAEVQAEVDEPAGTKLCNAAPVFVRSENAR